MVGNGGVMRITDLLDSRSVMLGAAPSDKKQTLEQAVALMVKSGKIADEEAYKSRFCQRRGVYNRNRRRNSHSSRKM